MSRRDDDDDGGVRCWHVPHGGDGSIRRRRRGNAGQGYGATGANGRVMHAGRVCNAYACSCCARRTALASNAAVTNSLYVWGMRLSSILMGAQCMGVMYVDGARLMLNVARARARAQVQMYDSMYVRGQMLGSVTALWV